MFKKIFFAFYCIFSSTASAWGQQPNLHDSLIFYFKKSDYNKAADFGEQLMAENRKALKNKDSALAVSANDLAFLYMTLGKNDLAESMFTKSLDHAKIFYGIAHPEYASILGNFGRLKKEQGKYEEAEALIKKAISILKNSAGEESEKYLNTTSDLGLLYLATGNYRAAETQFTQVLEVRKRSDKEQNINYTNALNNLAVVYTYMGNFSEAEKLFSQTISIFTKNQGLIHSNTATAIGNLGDVNISLGNYKIADSLLKLSLSIKEKIFQKNSDQYALALNALGKLYVKTGEFAEAEKLFRESLGIRKNLLGETHPNYAISLRNLGDFYFTTANDLKSDLYYKEALSLTKQNIGEDNLAYLNLSYSLGNINKSIGLKYTSDSIFRSSLLLEKKILLGNLEFLSEKELLAYLKNRETYYTIPYSLLMNYSSPQILESVINNCILFKGVTVQNTSQLTRQIEQSNDESLLKMWKEYKKNIAALYKILAQPIQKRSVNMDSLNNLTNAQEKQLLQLSAAYRDVKSKLNISWQDIRNNLVDSEAAIEFIRFKNLKRKITDPDTIYYAAMIIHPTDTVPVFVKLFEENELKQAMKNFAYKATGNTNEISVSTKPKTVTHAKNIYTLLWQPLEKYLKQTKTIYFSPDGLLHNLAFAAIPRKPGVLLCDRYNLVQLASTRQVAIKDSSRQVAVSAALFGGIDYNKQNTDTAISIPANPYAFVYQQNRSAGMDSFPYLPGTLKEVENIKKNMEQKQKMVSIYAGANATETVFRKLGDTISPAVIHFATHGFTLPDPSTQKTAGNSFKFSDNPLLRTGLVLAGGNQGWLGKSLPDADDGVLTALEISALSLQNTKLAVLSACESGTGQLAGSEGVFGLQRAFKIAGVNYVMASLWQVPDKETVIFMNYFYGQWLAGSNIRSSFLYAQQTMRKKYAPYYWAAFTLLQ